MLGHDEARLIVLLTILVGVIVGAAVGRGFDAALGGAFVGLIVGLAIRALRKDRTTSTTASAASVVTGTSHAELVERLGAMEQRIAALEGTVARLAPNGATKTTQSLAGMRQSMAATEASSEPTPPVPSPSESHVWEPLAAPTTTGAATVTESDATDEGVLDALAGGDVRAPVQRDDYVPPPMPAYGVRRGPRASKTAPERDAPWRFIAGGNTLARVGVIVLFVGVAFLLKYASEHMTIPITVRLAGITAGAIVLLLIGWRLRTRRAGYAMTLQGAAIGVLYLTVFAALRLYELLPPVAAFVLLFAIAALSSYLAVRQDAMALAILGVVGGFAAPLLTSRDAGNHVVLFSYYGVLNAGIFAIAWFKAWRRLNVIGFVCTFAIGTFWGVTRYRPEDFATTEPFLILSFLFYVAIGTLYAIRRATSYGRYVDAMLVFATPLIVAGLQSALVRDIPNGMAWSAFAGGVFYGALAWLLRARWRHALPFLIECYAALAVVFATLAVPLAFDARVTSATWALEGAAVVWAGTRQRHMALRLFGMLLQVASGIAFGLDVSTSSHRFIQGTWPVLNSHFIGEVLIVAAALISSRTLARAGDAITAAERAIVPVVFAWGVLWWFAAGSREIERHVADSPLPTFVVFVAASAVAFASLAELLAWPLARVPAFLSWPLLLVTALLGIVDRTDGHLFASWGAVAWLAALVTHVVLLRHFERRTPAIDDWVLDAGHAMLAWLVTLIGAHELAWLARQASPGSTWRIIPWGFVPMLVLAAIVRASRPSTWPIGSRRRAWLVWAAVPIVVSLVSWSGYANVNGTGDAAPVPFVPLLNPLDLTQALVFVAVARWFYHVSDVERRSIETLAPETLATLAGALLLYWVTFATLRTVHQWADVPWSAAAMWHARVVQTSLSLVWTIVALASMLLANHVKHRAAWLGGATLLAVVVAKLFVVDLSQVGGIERIVSFIGVGVLLLVIGYVAPVPPRRESA